MDTKQKRYLKSGAMLIVGTLMLCVTLVVNASAQSPIVLRYSSGLPPVHQVSRMQKFFAEEVSKKTEGRVKVEVYTGGQLYKHNDVVDAASLGAVDIGLNSTGHWGGRNPVFNFPNYFFLINGTEHWLRARDEVWKILEPLYQKQNVKLLHFIAYGESGVASVTPLDKPEDWKGKKIRGVTPGCFQSIATLGAVSTRIPEAEVYDAIGKKAIDGACSGWSSFYSRKYYEVVNNFTGPLWWSVWISFINLDKWKSLANDIQQTLLKVSGDTEAFSLDLMKEYDNKSLQHLKKVARVKYFTAQELKVWAQAIKPVHNIWLKECADKGYAKEGQQVYDALIRTQ